MGCTGWVADRLQLRVVGAPPAMGNGALGSAVVTADLVDDAVDGALEQVNRLGVPSDDVMLVRLDTIGPSVAERSFATVRVSRWGQASCRASPPCLPAAAQRCWFSAGWRDGAHRRLRVHPEGVMVPDGPHGTIGAGVRDHHRSRVRLVPSSRADGTTSRGDDAEQAVRGP